jgi:hypothetical protein
VTALVLPLLLTLTSASADLKRVPIPASVTPADLFELAAEGEVVLLPAHHSSPFSMAIVSRSNAPCSTLETAMLTPEGWPKRWKKMTNLRILERKGKRVSYEFEIDMFPVSPTLKGNVEAKKKGEVVFSDPDADGHAIFDLFDVPGGCTMLYHIWRPPGAKDGFAQLIIAIEKRADDASEIGGALATTRGYSHPERTKPRTRTFTPRAQAAWDELAGAGTVIRVARRGGGKAAAVVAKRRTKRKTSDVLWAIRNRRAYKQKLDTVTRVKDHGKKIDYTFGFFGGRVSLEAAVSEKGHVGSPEGLVITERVVDGDLSSGHWLWHVREVVGGTEVELLIDADFISGSFVWRTLAKQDPVIREGLQLQLVLAMMGDLIGGRLLGR